MLIANIGMYFLQMTVPQVEQLMVFIPTMVLTRPWTLVTYMFLHRGVMHIGFNMLALYFFGPRVEERLGTRHFAILYFISGISGALLSLAFAPQYAVLGASAGVFGVMLAFAFYWPTALIYIWGILPVPAWLLVVITTVLTLSSGIQGSRGGVADFAHLGGYVGAFIYLWGLQRSRTQFRNRALGVSGPAPRTITKKPVIDLKSVHEVNRDEVNRILDKISAQGLGSLTQQEKVFLAHFVPPDDRVPPVS